MVKVIHMRLAWATCEFSWICFYIKNLNNKTATGFHLTNQGIRTCVRKLHPYGLIAFIDDFQIATGIPHARNKKRKVDKHEYAGDLFQEEVVVIVDILNNNVRF